MIILPKIFYFRQKLNTLPLHLSSTRPDPYPILDALRESPERRALPPDFWHVSQPEVQYPLELPTVVREHLEGKHDGLGRVGGGVAGGQDAVHVAKTSFDPPPLGELLEQPQPPMHQLAVVARGVHGGHERVHVLPRVLLGERASGDLLLEGPEAGAPVRFHYQNALHRSPLVARLGGRVEGKRNHRLAFAVQVRLDRLLDRGCVLDRP